MKKNCIICDLDNVFFDSRKWHKYIPKEREDREGWDNFAKHVGICIPNKPFIEILGKINKLIPVIFLTGREQTKFLEEETKKQILKFSHYLLTPDINCKLIMRKENDYREVPKIKEEAVQKILLHYNPIIAIDDEIDNIKVYQKYKIPTLYYNKYRK